jgi:hypothetical protein
MARTHFYHTVLRRNPSTGDVEPLENVEAIPKTINTSTGLETGGDGIAYAARTGGSVGSNLTDENGVVQFYLDSGVDYNVHFTDLEITDRIAPFTVGVNSVSGGQIAGQVAAVQTLASASDTLLHAITSDLFVTTLREKLGVSDTSLARRGSSIIPTEEGRTSSTFGLLTHPDQVLDVVLPTDGLIFISYFALWKESTVGQAHAALFLDGPGGLNQLAVDSVESSTPSISAAEALISGAAGTQDRYVPLVAYPGGLGSNDGSSSNTPSNGASVLTTGQAVAAAVADSNSGLAKRGGLLAVFAGAGTYDVSVRFRATGGATVTAKERRLWVWTMGF